MDYYVVDYSRERVFGPFKNKGLANKVQTAARRVSDMFLEIGTNVVVFDDPAVAHMFQRGTWKTVNGKIKIVET